MTDRRRLLVMVSLAVMFGVLLWAAADGRVKAGRAAELAEENAGLRAEVRNLRAKVDEQTNLVVVLAGRVDQLKTIIEEAGLEVPPEITVVVEDEHPDPPSSTTTTTEPRPSTTTSTTACRPNIVGICLPR